MAHAVLVDLDVNIGAQILEALTAEAVDVSVFLWAVFPEYESPRLVIAAPWLDEFSPRARYEAIGNLLRGKFSQHSLPSISVRKMTDPFIEDLRSRLAPFTDIRGKRLRGESFGGQYVEDGYVYQIR